MSGKKSGQTPGSDFEPLVGEEKSCNSHRGIRDLGIKLRDVMLTAALGVETSGVLLGRSSVAKSICIVVLTFVLLYSISFI